MQSVKKKSNRSPLRRCSTSSGLFPSCKSRKVQVNFNGGNVSSDALIKTSSCCWPSVSRLDDPLRRRPRRPKEAGAEGSSVPRAPTSPPHRPKASLLPMRFSPAGPSSLSWKIRARIFYAETFFSLRNGRAEFTRVITDEPTFPRGGFRALPICLQEVNSGHAPAPRNRW